MTFGGNFINSNSPLKMHQYVVNIAYFTCYRMSRLWLRCVDCNFTFDNLPRHLGQSSCGPDQTDIEELENIRLAARAEAHNLTKMQVITEETLAELATRPEPSIALCNYLGVHIRGNDRRSRKVSFNISGFIIY